MSNLPFSLRHLDRCLTNRESLTKLRNLLEKIEKCCIAQERNVNLADLLHDHANVQSLQKAFGDNDFEVGLQYLIRVAMGDHSARSFVINTEISGEKKFDFIFKSVGNWKQFDAVISVQFPEGAPDVHFGGFAVINPQKQKDWTLFERIPREALITVYVKTVQGKRSHSQEGLALERYEAVFDVVQNRPAEMEIKPAASITVNANGHANGIGHNGVKKAIPIKRASTTPSIKKSIFNNDATGTNQTPIMSFTVVVNKMDTVVHAGNAHLILSHVQNFAGKVAMFVLRGEKFPVRLDADSIWGAEIRNGETVMFEFFGQKPADDFVKELAKKVNKYTQMDKLVNE